MPNSYFIYLFISRPLETAEENARRLTGRSDLILPYTECCSTNKSSIVECELCATEYCSPDCLKAAFERYHKTLCTQTRDESNNHPVKVLNDAWK